jgi:hypothetical protein
MPVRCVPIPLCPSVERFLNLNVLGAVKIRIAHPGIIYQVHLFYFIYSSLIIFHSHTVTCKQLVDLQSFFIYRYLVITFHCCNRIHRRTHGDQ